MTRTSVRGTVSIACLSLLCSQPAWAQQGWKPQQGWGGDSRTRHPAAGVNAAGAAVLAFAMPPTTASPLAVHAVRRPTPSAAWIGPELVSTGTTDAHSPQAAMSATGSAVVVWQQLESGWSHVRLSELVNGAAAWTAPLDLSPPGIDATGARVVVCGDVTTVVWIAGGVVQSRRRHGANVFEPAVSLDPQGATVAPVEVAVSATCEATAVWRRQTSGAEIVAAVASAATGAWSVATPLTAPAEDPSGPALSVAPDGRTTVAWRSSTSSADAVRAARRTGGAWSGAATLALTAGRVSGIALATDPTGVVTATWGVRSLNSQAGVIAYSRLSPTGAAWSAPAVAKVMTNITNIPRTLAAVADRTGTVTVAYGYGLNSDLPAMDTIRFDPFTGGWRHAGGFGGDGPVLNLMPNDGLHLTWLSYPQAGGPAFVVTTDFDATPRAPSIAAIVPADRAVTVTLMPPVSETGFEPVNYHYSIDDGATWTPRVPASPDATFTIGGLTNGVQYPLAVRAVNRAGSGDPSAPVTAVPVPVPLAPSNFRVAARTATSITLAWRDDGVTTADAFVIEGGVQPGQTLVSLTVAAPARTQVVSVGPGLYYARIHAVRGGVRSGPSNEVAVSQGLPVVPAAPRHLLGLSGAASVALSWTAALEGGPVDGYHLDVTGALSGTVTLPPSETFSAAGVPPGAYRVTVRAVNTAGSSPPSNPVIVFVPGSCAAPNPPEELQVSATGRTLRVTWAPPSAGAAVSRYDLLVQGSVSGTFPVATREITAVTSGTFTIRVVAVNACGASAPTPAVSIVVP